MITIKIAVTILVYIFTGGALFSDAYKRLRYPSLVAGFVAIAMSLIFWNDVYQHGLDLLSNEVANKIDERNPAAEADLIDDPNSDELIPQVNRDAETDGQDPIANDVLDFSKIEQGYALARYSYGAPVYDLVYDSLPDERKRRLANDYSSVDLRQFVTSVFDPDASRSITSLATSEHPIDFDLNIATGHKVGGLHMSVGGEHIYVVKDNVLQPAKWGILFARCQATACRSQYNAVILKSTIMPDEDRRLPEIDLEYLGFNTTTTHIGCSDQGFRISSTASLESLESLESNGAQITVVSQSNLRGQFYQVILITFPNNSIRELLKFTGIGHQYWDEQINNC